MPENQAKILIVDDEPGLRFSLTAFLEDEGFTVQGTASGEEALFLMKKQCFDAVIIDIRLPGTDGNEVMLESLRSGYSHHFLIHTGSADYQIPSVLKSYGINQDDIFLKPLPNLEIISRALHSRLAAARLPKAVAAS